MEELLNWFSAQVNIDFTTAVIEAPNFLSYIEGLDAWDNYVWFHPGTTVVVNDGWAE